MNSTRASNTLQDLLSAFLREQTQKRSMRKDHISVTVLVGHYTSSHNTLHQVSPSSTSLIDPARKECVYAA